MSPELLTFTLIILLAIVALLAVVILVLLWRLLKLPQQSPQHFETTAPTTSSKIIRPPDPTLLMCLYHPEERAHAACAISNEPICERCVREHEGVLVSAEYFKMLIENDWVAIETVMTTPDSPEASAHLYAFKKELWEKNQTPTFITTHYKIDVNEDLIESHISLNVRLLEQELLSEKLQKYQQGFSHGHSRPHH